MTVGITSNFGIVKKGVKQGDSLSCILFNMFLNDLTKIFNYKCEPVEIGERKVNHLLYAERLMSPEGDIDLEGLPFLKVTLGPRHYLFCYSRQFYFFMHILDLIFTGFVLVK